MALFKEVGAPARLGVLVEGESLFNDATAIVVFGLLLAMRWPAAPRWTPSRWRSAVPRVRAGVPGRRAARRRSSARSPASSHWRLDSPTPAMLAMSMAAAYVELHRRRARPHVSGVMAVVAAAVTLRRARRDAAHAATPATCCARPGNCSRFVCNSLLFLLVGLSVDLASLLVSWPLIVRRGACWCTCARAVAVYPLVPLTTRLFSLPRVGLARAAHHVVGWSQGRARHRHRAVGARSRLPERQLVLDVTVGVVLFTLLVNASTLRPLMHRLGWTGSAADERVELDEALLEARASASSAASMRFAATV